jgi:hypothetical protein
MHGCFAVLVEGILFKNELPKHCCVDLDMLVRLSQETLPHTDPPDSELNAAWGYPPEFENFFIAHATMDIFVL